MDFWQHLNASKTVDLQAVTEGLTRHLSELMLRGHSVADLLAHFADDFGHLPASKLRQLTQAHRRYQQWRRRRRTVEEARETAKLPPLPSEAFQLTPQPEQLDALVRTARLCPRDAVATDAQWLAVLHAGVGLWTRCVAICRQGGSIQSEAVDLEHPAVAAEFDDFCKSSDQLADLAPHRWLAMRRGQRDDILALRMDLPISDLEAETIRLQPKLGPMAADREPRSLLEELVLNDLEAWLFRLIDADAQQQAIEAASQSLAGLLRSQPVQARLLGAVYLVRPKGLGAVVLVDREGDLVAHKALRIEGKWVDRVAEFLLAKGPQQVVLPASAQTPELVTTIERRLDELGLHITKVRTAALSEARVPLTDPPLRLSSSVAAATVLARRALDPLKEWSLVDPVSIGIAEYQHDINESHLRAALADTVELCRLERRRGKRVSMGGGNSRGGATAARLNPLVKSLSDLRAGMSVHGVVTNISHFGAFVNIGLPQEALVHISELADKFVSNPNEVVSIGQQVNAHVLAIEPARGRISLSLKTQARVVMERERRPRAHGKSSSSQRAKAVPAQSKAQALANLEKLFRK